MAHHFHYQQIFETKTDEREEEKEDRGGMVVAPAGIVR
jgi:hypothetical protein